MSTNSQPDSLKATPDQRSEHSPQTARRIGPWLAIIAAVIFGGAFVVGGAVSMLTNPLVFKIALEHFAATVGLPSAAIASLCLVVFLESSSGPIEFEGLGFKFKGASGPVVLWAVCFLVMTAAIKTLW